MLPCQSISNRNLLSLSCKAEVETETDEHPNQLQVSLHGSGEIKLVSNLFIKTDLP